MNTLSYAGYREALKKLSRMHRDSYRQGYINNNHWRNLMREVKKNHPEHGDRFTREALGFSTKGALL
jgi:hypothetical protein